MNIRTKDQLLEYIRQQSLKLLKENGASAQLEDRLADIDESFVEVNEKRLARLNSEEEKAMEEENFAELQRIKQDKAVVLKKLIDSYQVKVRVLGQIRDGINKELEELGIKGGGVFKNKQITEFNNEDFQKGNTVKISTISSEIVLKKISDNNQYQILQTNASGLQPGDVLVVPNLTVGSSAKIRVYRQISQGAGFEEIGSPTLQNIKDITKNPA